MRSLLAVVLIALVGLGVWLLFGDYGEAATDSPRAPAAESEQSPATLSAETTDPVADRAAVPKKKGANESTELDVQVVRFGTGAPVAGATVRYAPNDVPTAVLWEVVSTSVNQELESAYEKRGASVTTDAEGRCRIPRLTKHRRVLARLGELYGQAYYDGSNERPFVVVMREDRTLQVRVLDAEGAPAVGATVHARASSEEDQRRLNFGAADRDGLVVARHTQRYAGDQTTRTVHVFAQGTACESERVPVELTAPPTTPLTLRLPPTGTVRFRLLEANGEPFDTSQLDWKKVVVGIFDHEPTPDEARRGRDVRCDLDERGRATLRNVALGKHVSAIVHDVMDDRLIVRGPTRHGQIVDCPIQLDAKDVRFIGRAVDAAGEPLPGHHVRVICDYRNGMSSHDDKTDAQGRFNVRVPWMEANKKATLRITCVNRDAESPQTLIAPSQPRTIQPGANDLGDVRFAAGPLLLSGKVVFPDGTKQRRLSWSVSKQPRGGRGWDHGYGIVTRWEADGRFEVRGSFPADHRFRLRFQDRRFRPMPPFEFDAGTRDVTLEAKRAASVAVDFLIDGDTPLSYLEFLFLPADKKAGSMDAQIRGQLGGSRVSDSRYHCEKSGLAAGRYDLLVRCYGTHHVLAHIRGIDVRDGEPVDDERLKAIDLRGMARLIEVKLRDAGGKTPKDRGAGVLVYIPDEKKWGPFRVEAGVARIPLMRPVDLYAWSLGSLLVNRQSVAAHCDIELPPAPRIRLRVTTPTLPDGVTLGIRIEPVPGTKPARVRSDHTDRRGQFRTSLRETATRHADGSFDARPASAGTYRVYYTLGKKKGGRVYGYDIEPQAIEVGENGGEFELRISQASITKTMKRFDRR